MDQPARLTLDRAAMLRWLTSSQVVAEDGRVWSWHNPSHPGYAYPEAGGLWLGLLARERDVDPDALERVAGWLEDCERGGSVGRDGRHYLFDHAMVLAGRRTWHERRSTSSRGLRPGLTTLLEDLDAGRATRPEARGSRWSERFGPHLLKLALPLRAWSDDEADARGALALLLDRLPVPTSEDRIITGPKGTPTYVHAHCYAAEGLWGLSESPLPSPARSHARAAATRAVAWLARIQRPDGGLPPWHDGDRGWGPAPADVAAQAVRLWCGLDRRRFAAPIDRALAFLARLAAPAGGLRYHEDSEDLNTWATVFAVQALDFRQGGADVRRLV